MDWTKILSVVFMVAMLAFIYPRMRMAIKHSPKGTAEDWKFFLVPVVGVTLFIILLIQMV